MLNEHEESVWNAGNHYAVLCMRYDDFVVRPMARLDGKPFLVRSDAYDSNRRAS